MGIFMNNAFRPNILSNFGLIVMSTKIERDMSYYLTKTLKNISISDAEVIVTEKLKEQGFGIVTQIDMQATLKAKIDKDIPPYKILGACNPHYAYKAVTIDDKIGVMLPCNVCLKQTEDGSTEVFTIQPMEAMSSINNPSVEELAKDITAKLEAMLASL